MLEVKFGDDPLQRCINIIMKHSPILYEDISFNQQIGTY